MGIDTLYLFDHDMPDMTMEERANEILKRFKAASRNIIRVDEFDDYNSSDYMMIVSEGEIFITKQNDKGIWTYIDLFETYVEYDGFPYSPAYARMNDFVNDFCVKNTPESISIIKDAITLFKEEVIPFFHSKLLYITGDSSGWDLTMDGLFEEKTIEETIATCPVKLDIYSLDNIHPFDESMISFNYNNPYKGTWPVFLHYF